MSAAASAAALVDDFVADAAEAPAPVDSPEPVAETPEPVAEPVFRIDREIPDEIAALLADDPDPDDEPPSFDPDDSVDEQEWEDPDRLRRELAKLQKKNEWLEQQRAKQGIKNWRAEAAEHFPLADANDIQAGSRKEFLRVAAAQHAERAKGAKLILDRNEEVIAAEVAKRVAEAEEKLRAQWGTPVGGPGVVPVRVAEADDALARINQAKTLHERIKLKMDAGIL